MSILTDIYKKEPEKWAELNGVYLQDGVDEYFWFIGVNKNSPKGKRILARQTAKILQEHKRRFN